MKAIINNIRLLLEEAPGSLEDEAAAKLRIPRECIKSLRILKESVDARRKPKLSMVYSVMVESSEDIKLPKDGDIKAVEEEREEQLLPGNLKLNSRPIIIGSGPAGLFAGLVLARNGYRPLIVERGECVEKRNAIVLGCWNSGILNTEVNVQFGEGGAGTFSDGKLTTRINDRRCEMVLQEFFRCGAPEEILYKARPHIGSDNLRDVVANLRNSIVRHGGEVRFNTKLTGLTVNNGRVEGIELNGGERMPAGPVVLAIGHSARDTFKMLLESGVQFVQKPFSIGVRIEHRQELVNFAQYGSAAGNPRLGAADYQLYKRSGDRTVYSFCMCPGGLVVASASEPETIVTNGMSDFARDRENSNSALVVSVEPGDFGSTHPLAGVEFQREWEKRAFIAGGRDGSAPVQRLGDFVDGRVTKSFGTVKPSYTGNTRPSDLNLCLPGFVTDSIKGTVGYFDRKLKGFGTADALLTGVETRTSSPVRILRDDLLEAYGIKGLYPAGEGAGYAGGIVSAAVDGIRVAEQIIRTYSQLA